MEQVKKVRPTLKLLRAAPLAGLVLAMMAGNSAQALPIFARQTGMACLSCHTVYPELTHFGRMFKLNGYQLDNLKDIQVTTDDGELMLSLPPIPGWALFVQSDYTVLKKPLPDSQIPNATSQSSQVGFPQQVSLLWGGKIAPHFGAFAQLTYGYGSGTINIDNTDMRFANNFILPDKKKLTYGLSLNNSPGLQDLYNTTASFGFPYVLPGNAGVGLAGAGFSAPQLQAALAYKVVGLTGYVMWNEELYGELGFYHHSPQGKLGNPITKVSGPLDSQSQGVLANNAPYLRIAYEKDIDAFALEVGTQIANFKLFPGAGTVGALPADSPGALGGPTNDYKDVSFDTQLQYVGENHIGEFHVTHIHESITNGAGFAAGGTANPTDSLNFLEVDATYYYKRKIGASLALVNTSGSADAGLYPGAAGGPTLGAVVGGTPLGVVTSAANKPDTNSYIAEVNYLPWLNVKLTAQYTHYTKFNGGSTNYDGAGRNASDNDTMYLNMWFAF